MGRARSGACQRAAVIGVLREFSNSSSEIFSFFPSLEEHVLRCVGDVEGGAVGTHDAQCV